MLKKFKYRKYIYDYLSRTYFVADGFVFNQNGKNAYLFPIKLELINVFGFDDELTEIALKRWAKKRKVNIEGWELPHKLNVAWTPELVQDVSHYHGIDFEAELTAMLSAEISKEIDAEILRNVMNLSELQTRMSEVGYKLSQAVYDPNDFTPRKYFILHDDG